MARITIFFSILLIGLALFGYFGSADENPSKTSLIPAAFGIPMLILGLLAIGERFRMHAMHGAAAIGLLGFLMAGGRGGMKIGVLFSDDPDVNKRPVIMVITMAVICLVFVLLCVKSFIDARRRQAAERRASSSVAD